MNVGKAIRNDPPVITMFIALAFPVILCHSGAFMTWLKTQISHHYSPLNIHLLIIHLLIIHSTSIQHPFNIHSWPLLTTIDHYSPLSIGYPFLDMIPRYLLRHLGSIAQGPFTFRKKATWSSGAGRLRRVQEWGPEAFFMEEFLSTVGTTRINHR